MSKQTVPQNRNQSIATHCHNFNFIYFTDLCSSEHLPEVEIFSLLEEQIPKYKLRVDSLTQFGGYENQVKKFKMFTLC